MPFTEDLTAFFDLDEFADAATFTPAGGGPAFTVNGIFDAPYQLNSARDVQIDTDKPRFTCRSSDVTAVRREDGCTIAGRQYDVLAVEPDGTGVSVVVLAQ